MRMVTKNFWMLVVGFVAPLSAFAAETTSGLGAGVTFAPVAVGLGIALAVIAAATAQGKIASAFMEGVSRNPSAQKAMFVPLIIGLAFVETLVLFTFLVVQGLAGKF